MTSNLLNIKQFGQKIWLDNLSRGLLQSGVLERLIADDGIAGVTSNPTIFHKAIANDELYQKDLYKVKNSLQTLEERYENLVIPDICQACDLLLPLYAASGKEDGYVSFEVSPYLANDSAATIINAKALWQIINRPNLMIKVPATRSGITAFEQLIKDGINVNITLLFSLDQVIDTWRAYINGLNYRLAKKLPLSHIKAVASFFLSRIDSAIDPKLPTHLRGKGAIYLAKAAYLAYQEIFNGKQFEELRAAGAKPQYLLWASTGTKNSAYSDVMYVEELIGKDTINTIPDGTLDAFRDHGKATGSLIHEIDNAPKIIEEIKQFVDMQALGTTLQQEGLKSFVASFDNLLLLVK